MKILKTFLFAAVAGIAGLGLAAPAGAQQFPTISLAPPVVGLAAPDPEPGSDGWLLDGTIVGSISDASNFTGLVSTGIPDGKGIALQDHDLVGTEGGGPPSDSDYFYIFQNVVYWDSDSETSIPILTHQVDPSQFLHVQETGSYQDFSSYFGLGPGNTIAIFSDAGVPEPASWALMIGGFGLAGAALRRRRAVTA